MEFRHFLTQGAQFIHDFVMINVKFAASLVFFDIHMAGHGIDDNGDEQVQDSKGGDQNERDKEHPRHGIGFHHRADDPHRPAFKRHDLEQGIKRRPDGAKPFREARTKQLGRHDGRDIKHQRQQGQHRYHAGNGAHQGFDHFTHGRDGRYQAEGPQDTQGPQYRKPLTGGQKGDGDDREIKNVPGALKEGQPIDKQFERQFDDKNGNRNVIKGLQHGACDIHD